MQSATIVRVEIEASEPGVFRATSKEVDGLLVYHETLEALEDAIPSAIVELMERRGILVQVYEMDRHGACGPEHSWIVVPTLREVQRAELPRPSGDACSEGAGLPERGSRGLPPHQQSARGS